MKISDLEISTSRKLDHVPGGQSCGLERLDVIIRHIPTGISARCGTERSQTKNRDIAMRMVEWGLVEVEWKDPE
jgi:peptide chain release factor 2